MRRHQSFETFLIGKSVLMREGIVRILRAENFRVRASVSSPDELTGTFRGPQLLFLIVHTGDDFALAVAQISLMRDKCPNARVVVVADHYRSTEPDLAFQVGAAGYLVSDMSCDAFVKSIELVMMGEAVFPPAFQTSAHDTGASIDATRPAKTTVRTSSCRTMRARRSSLPESWQSCVASSTATPTSASRERSISQRRP